jgi:hypothetical protein
MKLKSYHFFFSLLLCFSLSYCSQPAQEQEKPETETEHNNHENMEHDAGQKIEQQTEPDTLKGSLKAAAHGQIGNAHLMISYHSPAVRGRVIWGGLVAYNQVWVTGAHSATNLTVDNDITIGGKQLPAGKYALFTIPGENEWTIIINKNWEQHLADDYAEADDVLRLTIKPEITELHQERLRYQIVSENNNKGAILITWDKLKVTIPIGV